MERYHFACKFAKNRSILDIACGVGYSAPLFIQAGAISYDGVDLNEKRVTYASHAYGSDQIKFFIGDICFYKSGKTYDMITCYETIEHVENYESALKNLYSLLKPGGMLFISSPNRLVTSPRALHLHHKPANEFHTQEFTPEELLVQLLNAGFIAGSDDIYGQRLRRQRYSNIFMRILHRVLFNPDNRTSPAVTSIGFKLPRYFIIVATKNND